MKALTDLNAREFVENFLDRLEQDGAKYKLPGGTLTAREVEAFRALADIHKPTDQLDEPPIIQPQLAVEHTINLGCLSEKCDDNKILCVDFGTAFSKAAIWDQSEKKPNPLPIGQGLSADPLLIDSVVYIGQDKIFFGPKAVREYVADSDGDRKIFTSPKELLNLDYETIQTQRPSAGVDPHKIFKNKDLLILFLGYLTALTKRELASIEIIKPVLRRFAAPGWGDAQQNLGGERFDMLVDQMSRFLAEAQILADSFEIDLWLEGIEVSQAKSAISQLSAISDAELLKAPFIERPVLEVTAAASSIKEKLLNKRPQVVVVDVGAGTTDIGAFKYVGSDEEPKFAAYKRGLAALDMAGNRLDDAFKSAVRKVLDLGDNSTASPKLERELTQNIHRYKKELFSKGSVTVSISGLPDVIIQEKEFTKSPIVKNFQKKFREKVTELLNKADGAGGASFTDISSDNYVVFTGGGGGLRFLHDVFNEGFEIDAGRAIFERIDLRPSWLDDASEAVQSVFPQIAVSVGGASPDLPKVLPTIGDTSKALTRTIRPIYKS